MKPGMVATFSINGSDCACLYIARGPQRKAIGEDACEPGRVAHQTRSSAVPHL